MDMHTLIIQMLWSNFKKCLDCLWSVKGSINYFVLPFHCPKYLQLH